MLKTTGLLDVVILQERALDREAHHESGVIHPDVPVPGDLHRVVLAQHWVEDQLFGQTLKRLRYFIEAF